MRIKFYIPALLAITGQVRIKAQIHENSVYEASVNIESSINRSSERISNNSNTIHIADLLKQAYYCDSIAKQIKEAALDRNTAEKEMMIAEVVELHAQSLLQQFEASTLLSENLKKSLTQARYYDSVADKLWNSAKRRQPVEKEMMLDEIDELREQSIIKQIEASTLTAIISYLNFYRNNISINSLTITGESKKAEAINLNSEAHLFFKRAEAIRQDAFLQHTNQAGLGLILNAEELEFLALKKQNKAIELLKRSTSHIEYTGIQSYSVK